MLPGADRSRVRAASIERVDMTSEQEDSSIARLARLFAEHPAWVDAARHLGASAESSVYFTHRPGEVWRLRSVEGGTRLDAGPSRDPDFALRFSPESIDALAAVEGDIGAFAVALFEQIEAGRIDLRIHAGFARLARRGYVTLVLAAGPAVVAYGARHGIRGLGALRRLVGELATRRRSDWEQ